MFFPEPRTQNLLNLRGGEGVEGVGAPGQGEEIGVAGLKMGYVGQPLFDEQDIAPLHVARQVPLIRDGQAVKVGALGQFLGQVEDRQQQAGEGVVFQQVGVFQEAQEEVPFFQQEIPQIFQVARFDLNTEIVFRQALAESGKIRRGPVADMGHPQLEVGKALVVS